MSKAGGKVAAKIAAKKEKIAAKKEKIAAKCGKRAAKCAVVLIALAFVLAGCATADPSSRSTSGEYGDTEPTVKVVFEKGSSNNTATITMPITLGDAAVASADSSGSTETQTASPTNTTDIKPKTDVNTTGGRSAGVLETAIQAGAKWLTSPGESASCKDGSCSDGSCKDGSCSDGSCRDGSCSTCKDCEL